MDWEGRRTLFYMSFPAKTGAEAILKVALKIVEKEGWEALSMRSIGLALGVRASSLYHHYRDKGAIEGALGELASRVLLCAMTLAAGRKKGRVRLVAMADAYVAFARENAALYQLLAARRSASDEQAEGTALWEFLLDGVGQVTGNPRDTAAAIALWSFLHGLIALEAAGKFDYRGWKGGYERGLSAILAGLIR